ncbi:hypothetical protein EJ05DRAFT_314313 [Pseudovirgaria hyperparasitica]|uniref:Uncharacterized protein n=1 Tax=Pseudovirgaria hyperparasitica TaxID=470096 RepID=A0A6A6WCK2_9PEZI|nr:uncharacterized protein EJ05DRAFT_314313 [Pseudovirgaria hyperparasitica]KAF2759909.1 hypothetical protein EJ05DRAFT_314313 [Pseudovirgaria hyperparasitica]
MKMFRNMHKLTACGRWFTKPPSLPHLSESIYRHPILMIAILVATASIFRLSHSLRPWTFGSDQHLIRISSPAHLLLSPLLSRCHVLNNCSLRTHLPIGANNHPSTESKTETGWSDDDSSHVVGTTQAQRRLRGCRLELSLLRIPGRFTQPCRLVSELGHARSSSSSCYPTNHVDHRNDL